MKRVLVTGAGGFIGELCLAKLNDRGYSVAAISRSREGRTDNGVEWHKADLLAPGQIGDVMQRCRPTHLLHLAWVTKPGEFWTSPDNRRWVEASTELLKSFREHGGRRALFAGTCAEYNWKSGPQFSEQSALEPHTTYGICKDSFRRVVSELSADSGMEYVWARLFFLYGPREQAGRLIPTVIEGLLANRTVDCSSGEQVRDFLYVEDAARGLTELLDSDFQGEVNLASGLPVRLKDLVLEIAKLIGTGTEALLRFGALPARPDDPESIVADVRTLRNAVTWRPEVPLDEGLKKTLAWHRSRT